MNTLLKVTTLPAIMVEAVPIFNNASCSCSPSTLLVAAQGLYSAIEFVDDAIWSALDDIPAALGWLWATIPAAYGLLPSVQDVTLFLALYHAHILLKVRPLDSHSRAYNALLYSTRLTVIFNALLAFYHLARWPLVTLYHLSLGGGSLLGFPSRLVHAAAAATPSGSAYLPIPSALFVLATNVFALTVIFGLMSLYPVDGIPMDTGMWEDQPKPLILQEQGVNAHMGMTVVLRLRAQGIEPEIWRRGSRPDFYEDTGELNRAYLAQIKAQEQLSR